jgi:hypothetical protein
VIVDSGILIAAADRADRHHRSAVSVLGLRETFTVPEPVVVEAAWLIARHGGVEAEAGFIRGIDSGDLSVEPTTMADRARAAELILRYADAQIGYVDAVIIAIAERTDETTIATIDRRHFSMVRPRHIEAFELLPQMTSK